MAKIALMGTCNDTTWRQEIINKLVIDYYNPVITDREWTEEDRAKEILERRNCELVLYVFTPRMTGLFSIAEVTDDSNKRPGSTILCILEEDISDKGKRIVFTPSVKKSLDAIATMVKSNGAKVCYSLESAASIANSTFE